ncbi:MAG TPA: hypothetical protein VN442_20600 [Bryobacteraceae bacterium]|nr:hypothetical protein [Bryobacteraceae bacterium]
MRGVGPEFRKALVLTLAALCCSAQTRGLRLVVVEGEGALNSVDARRAKEPVVRVEDAEERPIAGAVVNFILPAQGPGAEFPGGEMSFTGVAGEDGTVVGRGLRPNRIAGPFQIRVTASARGETATAIIRQTNVASAEEARSSSRKYVWLAVIGGAAVAGVLAATLGGSSTPASTIPSGGAGGGTIVVPGPPSFAPPR